MSLKLRLARVAARVEVALEQVLIRPERIVTRIEPYTGYATPENLVVRGRLLASPPGAAARDGQSRLRNLRQMLRLFATDEVANVPVTAGGVSGKSDEEGYFTLHLPRGDTRPGRVEVTVTAGEVTAICPVLVTGAEAAFGVISDIDDTMMRTGAFSLWRNLWTSLTGNPLTREVFPDAVRLVAVLRDGGRNPVFFVSSSPWNFHGFLSDVFRRNGLPEAPMFLRDYGISETQFITGTHGDHKGGAIDTLMAAHPGLGFVLVGDAGQHDPHVYADAAERHPGRVRTVILRDAGDGVKPDDRAQIDRLRARAVEVFVATDYDDAIAALR